MNSRRSASPSYACLTASSAGCRCPSATAWLVCLCRDPRCSAVATITVAAPTSRDCATDLARLAVAWRRGCLPTDWSFASAQRLSPRRVRARRGCSAGRIAGRLRCARSIRHLARRNTRRADLANAMRSRWGMAWGPRRPRRPRAHGLLVRRDSGRRAGSVALVVGVAAGLLVGVDVWGWDELGSSVGAESHGPAVVGLVDEVVVAAA